MENIYSHTKEMTKRHLPSFYSILEKYKLVIKYLIAGTIAAATDLGLLYFFTEMLGIYYLFSASIAFILAFFVSFYLQKFWTFRDESKEKIYSQMTIYFAVALFNMVLNDVYMYILVEKVAIMYLLAQIIAGLLVAGSSFFLYRYLIFKK